LKMKSKKEKTMVLKKISDEWYSISLKRQGRDSLTFFGISKREVIGKLKQQLRQEEYHELLDSL
jgi:hypothetical protein